MIHRFVAILALIALLSTSACAAASAPQASAPAESAAARPAPPPAPAAGAAAAPRQAATGSAASATDAQQSSVPSLDRMIVRTVTMTIAVDDVKDVFHKVEELAGAQNGYLAGSQIRQDSDRLVATVTLRVPGDNATYQATLEQLRGLAKEVVDEQSQAQDVTDQYVDVEMRLGELVGIPAVRGRREILSGYTCRNARSRSRRWPATAWRSAAADFRRRVAKR